MSVFDGRFHGRLHNKSCQTDKDEDKGRLCTSLHELYDEMYNKLTSSMKGFLALFFGASPTRSETPTSKGVNGGAPLGERIWETLDLWQKPPDHHNMCNEIRGLYLLQAIL